MKRLEKMNVYVGTFIVVSLGYIVTYLASDFIIDILSGVLSGVVIFPKHWGLGKFSLDGLTSTSRLRWLVYIFGWLSVSILVHYGTLRWLEDGEKIGILSFFFLKIWLNFSFAVIVGYTGWSFLQGYSEVITLDPTIPGNLVDQYFEGLFWVLSPTIAVLLGVNSKYRSSD